MSSDSVIRALLDLLLYWVASLISVAIAKPLRLPPLLFYLIIGALYGNFGIVERGEQVEFFTQFSITMVFFALGLEETVEHFVKGLSRSYKITLIGGVAAFGVGYSAGVLFFPDAGWYVHLVLGTALLPKPVSLTMMVLHSLGLLNTRPATCIMTTAVLDDVIALIVVGIVIPVAVAAAPSSHAVHEIPAAFCCVNTTTELITGHIAIAGESFPMIRQNTTAWSMLQTAVSVDIANASHAPFFIVSVQEMIVTGALNISFSIESVPEIGVAASSVWQNLKSAADDFWLWKTSEVYNSSTTRSDHIAVQKISLDSEAFPTDLDEENERVTVWGVSWIVIKVVIFFIIVYVLHTVILPNNITEGWVSYVPLIRSYGMQDLISCWEGTQVPLICVAFGMGVAMISAFMGFHPAIGAYFAGLILQESYFDMPSPADPETKEPTNNTTTMKDTEKQGISRRTEPVATARKRSPKITAVQPKELFPEGSTQTPGPQVQQNANSETPAKDSYEISSRRPSVTSETTPPFQRKQQKAKAGRTQNPRTPLEPFRLPPSIVVPWEVPVSPVVSPGLQSQTEMRRVETIDGCSQSSKEMENKREQPQKIINTFERAKDPVGTAALLYLGPTFFVHLGGELIIKGSLLKTAIPQALGVFAMLWVVQFTAATGAAYFAAGSFTWQESCMIGFGMLGRAEIFFVVLRAAQDEGLIDINIFFPMAVAAMLMNISLPICISLFQPIYRRRHPERIVPHEPIIDEAEIESARVSRQSSIVRRAVGMDGYQKDIDDYEHGTSLQPRRVGSVVLTQMKAPASAVLRPTRAWK